MGNEGLVLDVSGTNVLVTLSLADPDENLLQYEVTGATTLSEYQQVGGQSLWMSYLYRYHKLSEYILKGKRMYAGSMGVFFSQARLTCT